MLVRGRRRREIPRRGPHSIRPVRASGQRKASQEGRSSSCYRFAMLVRGRRREKIPWRGPPATGANRTGGHVAGERIAGGGESSHCTAPRCAFAGEGQLEDSPGGAAQVRCPPNRRSRG